MTELLVFPEKKKASSQEIIRISDIKIGERFRTDQGDIEELAQSIKSQGLFHLPVLGQDNELIAGYRRIQALKLLGIQQIGVRKITVKDAVKAQIDENKIRKDFTPSEWVAIGAYLEPKLKSEAEAREKAGKKIDPTQILSRVDRNERTTSNQVSKYLGVSRVTYDKAKKIVNAAEKEPEVFNPLVQEMDKKNKIDRTFRKFKHIETERNRPALPPTVKAKIDLRLGDFKQNDIGENSIDLILTDPQYNKEKLGEWSELSKLASKILKPSAFLVAYSGQLYLSEVLKGLSECLTYRWTIALIYADGTKRLSLSDNHVMQAWKPIFIFQKDPKTMINFHDILDGRGRNKEIDEMAQNVEEMRDLLKIFSKPNDLVFEPFAGLDGTTLEACYKEERHCIAYEIDPERCNLLQKRYS